MDELTPQQQAAVKDANLLTQLSFAFAVLGIIGLILPKRFADSAGGEYPVKYVMTIIFFTATVVLGGWAFIRLLSGPRTFPKGYQFLLGIGFGMSLWTLPFIGAFSLPVLCALIVVAATLNNAGRVGSGMLAGGLVGCLLPILILFGVCAFVR